MELINNLFSSSTNRLLRVVETSFISDHRMTFDELFDGFDQLLAVTYSSDVHMMNKLFCKFNYSEVIFGWPKIINKEQRSLFDIPYSIIKYYGKNKNLRNIAELLQNNKVKLLTLHDFKSHAKMYLLSSSDGRKRVVTGSANLSTAAMYGYQNENISFDDTPAAYDYYYGIYQELFNQSGEINKNIFLSVHTKKVENIDLALEQASVKDIIGTDRAVIIEGVEDSKLTPEDVTPVAIIDSSVRKMNRKEIEDLLGKRDKGLDGQTKIVILSDQLLRQKRLIISNQKEKKDYDLPSIDIDFLTKKIKINNEIIEDIPSQESICKDIECIIEYFNGLNNIKGNTDRIIKNYWKFLCWYLATPFIPRLRIIAIKNGYETYDRLNNIGVLYGSSNAGKTKLCQFITKLMDGNIRTGLPPAYFTPSKIDSIRSIRNGFPIFFEDVDSGGSWSRFENCVVKSDNYGISEGWDLYPCVVICMNRSSFLNIEAKKRCLAIRVEGGFDSEETYISGQSFKDKTFKVQNNFYKYYLLKMYDRTLQLETDMIDNKKDIEYNISVISSQVIIDIIKEVYKDVPSFMYELSGVDDFAGDTVKFQSGIEMLSQLISISPDDFEIKKSENQLIFRQSANGTTQIPFLRKELPYKWMTMDKAQMSRTLVLNLDQVINANINISHLKKDSFILKLCRLFK